MPQNYGAREKVLRVGEGRRLRRLAGQADYVASLEPDFETLSDEELAANPGLVKSKNVRPPVGTGKIRLVCIGENAAIDSQPCGGTHVARTSEVGEIHVGKIEKKGRENRRFRIRFGPMPLQ